MNVRVDHYIHIAAEDKEQLKRIEAGVNRLLSNQGAQDSRLGNMETILNQINDLIGGNRLKDAVDKMSQNTDVLKDAIDKNKGDISET